MPDLRKADHYINMTLNMKALARVHYFCLKGIQGEIILDERQARTHYEFLTELENVLIRSGYMTPAEIRARHTNMPEVLHGDKTKSQFTLS